jgi:uncharacterized protein (DUF58 family)
MLTFRGRTTLLLGIALGIAGFSLRYGELIALALGALAALLIGWFWVRGHNAISVTRLLEATELEAGQDIAAAVSVSNISTQTFHGGVLFETLQQITVLSAGGNSEQLHTGKGQTAQPSDPGRATQGGQTGQVGLSGLGGVVGAAARLSVPVRVGRIEPKGQIVTSYVLPKSTRGEYQLGPLRFEQADVFGLWRKTRHFDTTETILVRPKVHDLLGEATGRQQQAPSRTANPTLSSSIAFDRLRAYVVGDDLRRVHWKTSARAGELMVRETLDEIVDDILILIDDKTNDVQSKHLSTQGIGVEGLVVDQGYEELVEIAASIATYAAQIGQRCRIRTSSGGTAEQNAGIVSTDALRLLALAVPTGVGIDHESAGLKTLRPGGKQFLLTTRGEQSESCEFVRQAATMIGRRSPRTHLIEIGPFGAPSRANQGAKNPSSSAHVLLGPVQASSHLRWHCEDANGFVKLWPEMEHL